MGNPFYLEFDKLYPWIIKYYLTFKGYEREPWVFLLLNEKLGYF